MKLSDQKCKLPFQNLVLFDFDGKNCNQYIPCMESINFEDVCQTHKLPNVMEWQGEQLTPEEVFKHPKFIELQQSFIDKKEHPWCNSCWKSDDPRYKKLTQFERDCNGLMIDFFIGNKCNLGCRTCTPFASNRLIKDEKYFIENNLDILSATDNFFYQKDTDPLNSIQWKWIKENPDKIKGLTLAGGEPLFVKEIIDTLNEFVRSGASKEINLQLRTNGMFLDKHKEMLSKFKGIYLHLSVDAVDDLYHYIRYPGNFDTLEKSYFNFIDYCSNVKYVYILSVVNSLNVLNLNEVILWAENKMQFVEVIPQHRGIGIRSMSEELLQLAIDRSIDSTLSKLIKRAIESIIPNKKKMLREITYFDRSRNQSYKEYLDPKLIEWLNEGM